MKNPMLEGSDVFTYRHGPKQGVLGELENELINNKELMETV